jgi:acyl-CoA synthetase (AMP-forming)/AMP-acid ligase II
VDLARNLIGRINVGDSLTRAAAARPGQLAVMDGQRRLSYADFNTYVNRLAHGLAGLGYERGAALALASGNSADFLAVYYACAKLGVVCVPINLGWQPEEVAYVLGHSGARGIVVESQLLTAMRDAIAKFVVTRPGETIDAAELIAALKTHLAGFKVPKAVVFVDQLPKTSTGKIQKNVVRSEYAAHYATSEG